MPKWSAKVPSPTPSTQSPRSSPRGVGSPTASITLRSDKEAALIAAIEDAVHHPKNMEAEARRRQLTDAYTAVGAAAAERTLDKCIHIMKDTAEGAQPKMLAVRILDLLMELRGDALAEAIASQQMKFLKDLAKRAKDKEKKKSRPPIFPTNVTDREVASFYSAVCELLDWYGRHYAGSGGTMSAFPKTRQELLRDGVRLPTPEEYQIVQKGKQEAKPRGTEGASGALEERELQIAADEAKEAVQQHGKSDSRAAEARARLESMIEKWQRAAAQVVDEERGADPDFEEFERLSKVLHRYQEVLADLDKEKTASSPGTGSARGSTSKKKTDRTGSSRRSSRTSSSASTATPHEDAAPAWDTEGLGGGSFGASAFGATVDQGFGGFQEPNFGPPPTAVAPPTAAPLVVPPSAALGGVTPNFGALPGEWAPPDAHLSADSLQAPLPPQQVEEQLNLLQVQLQEMRSRERVLGEQLQAAHRRIRELEPLELETENLRAAITTLREANTQLHAEADHLRRELRQSRVQHGSVADKLSERESVISQTRQRLFDEKRRSSQLEDEIRNQVEVQRSMQGRLEKARSQQTVTELELQLARDSLAHHMEMPWSDNGRVVSHYGNVAYGSGYKGGVASAAEPFDKLDDVRNVSRPSRGRAQHREPSVSRSDELADSAPTTPGVDSDSDFSRGRSRDESLPPLRDLARRGGEAEHRHRHHHGEAPGPTLSRSSWDVWERTTRVIGPPGSLIARTPPAPRVCLERTNANFRQLLGCSRGRLYEDDRVTMEMIVSPASSSHQGTIRFEVVIANCGNHPIQQVQLRAFPSQQPHAYELRVGSVQNPGGVLWRHQQLRYRCELEVFCPFEAVPQVELSYLLADNLCLGARLRLPLTVALLFEPPPATRVEAPRFLELWESADFAHAEVAVVCSLRRELVDASSPFAIARCLELGGSLRCLPGIEECPRSVALVSSFPQRQGVHSEVSSFPQRQGVHSEVLVRAEIGGPPGAGAGAVAACRLAVRSSSHVLNRSLLQALLDAVGDVVEPAVAA